MAAPMFVIYLFCFLVILLSVLFFRVLYIILTLGKVKTRNTKSERAMKLLVVAGSGGHTSELLRLLGSLSGNYKPRVYVLANTDKMSRDKVQEFESKKNSEYSIEIIPRSREVRQSYLTSIASTLYATWYAFPLVFRVKPDLVLVNGPGTCIPICAASFMLRVLGLRTVIQVYVESICRVEHLSVSGLIMYYFADKLLVQWPQLVTKYPRAQYIGRIV